MNDQPAQRDSLGFSPFVRAVYEHLTDQWTKPPITMAVEAEWGGGKTSFMVQLRNEIERGQPQDYVVWFNAWRHDKDESVWAAFAVELVRQLNHGKWRKCDWWRWRWVRRLADRIARMRGVRWLAATRPIQWIGRCWRVRRVRRLARVACPLTWLSVLWWLGWKARTATKLFWFRFDWDRGWWDVLRTAVIGAAWSVLFYVGLCALIGWGWPESLGNWARNHGDDDGWKWLTMVSGGIGLAATFALKFTGNPLRYNLRKYFCKPDYADKVAFIERFHADFNSVVRAMVGSRRIYVFVDDLDRCDVPRAAELMQALNLMIPDAGPDAAPGLLYILGLDREKIAAGLAAKFDKVLPYMESLGSLQESSNTAHLANRGQVFGQQFLQKFIQLPCRLPVPAEASWDEFVRGLFTDISARDTANSEDEADPAPGAEGADKWDTFLDERHGQTMQTFAKAAAPLFGQNPRRVKQYVHVLRLQARIVKALLARQHRLKDVTVPQLAKFVAVTLAFPRLAGVLREDPHLLAKLIDAWREEKGDATQ